MGLSGSVAVLSLDVLEQSHEFANLQEIKLASAEQATCAACAEGTRALLHALCLYALWVKLILVDFNLVV